MAPERCTRQLPTNAYGEIDFLGQGKQAKRSPVSLSFFLCSRVWLFLRPCNLWTFFTQRYFRAEIIESSLSVSQRSLIIFITDHDSSVCQVCLFYPSPMIMCNVFHLHFSMSLCLVTLNAYRVSVVYTGCFKSLFRFFIR